VRQTSKREEGVAEGNKKNHNEEKELVCIMQNTTERCLETPGLKLATDPAVEVLVARWEKGLIAFLKYASSGGGGLRGSGSPGGTKRAGKKTEKRPPTQKKKPQKNHKNKKKKKQKKEKNTQKPPALGKREGGEHCKFTEEGQ